MNYVPSTLTPTRTLLEHILHIERYLKENPISQIFSLAQVHAVEPNLYDVAALKPANKSVDVGDIVFFANSVYAFVQTVSAEKFTLVNFTSFVGPQGIQGEQGATGEQGAPGERGTDALVLFDFPNMEWRGTESALNVTDVDTFNRIPIVGEQFVFMGKLITTGITSKSAIMIGEIISSSSTVSFKAIKYIISQGDKGNKGDTGAPGATGLPGANALVMNEPYRSGRLDSGTTAQISPSLFNRQPVYFDDVLVYCIQLNPLDNSETLIGAAQCKVTGVQGDSIQLTSFGFYPIPISGGKAGKVNYSHLSFPNEAPGAPTLKELFDLLKTEYIQSILVHGTDSSGTRDFLVYQPNISFPQGASEVALIPYNDIMSAPRFFGINATDKNVIWGSQTATTIFTEGEISVVSIKLNVD